MANFGPLKKYMLLLLDELIEKYELTPPFLDAGCGRGDVSLHLAVKQWSGKAIDFSSEAVEAARANLENYSQIEVAEEELLTESSAYNTIILWDVLEHVPNDREILKHLCKRLNDGGYLVLSIPTNRSEWRWDDRFYGHLRRYDYEQIKQLLTEAGFDMMEFWDFTFPVFWLMRRLYTWFKSPEAATMDPSDLTRRSSLQDAWDIGFATKIVTDLIPWRPIYLLQKSLKTVRLGHEALLLAQKKAP